MIFSRKYTLEEVKGLLQIYRGNQAITGVNSVNSTVQRSPAAAHAHIHGGANFLEQRARVNTPGEPRKTGTYWSEQDQAAATLEVLNSDNGRIALRQLDIGESSAVMEAYLTPGRFRVASAQDASQGVLGRNNPARAHAGSINSQGFASKGFVKVVKGVGGQLQIQTSFPIV
ncbi:hypothetical protein WJR50_30780 [Catalinimonas sp. 4WD22]|uniref:hypothetical protein n=1 Tax=Catalinimonas locisalis TaxID=3133978 RepID=UPI0031012BBB